MDLKLTKHVRNVISFFLSKAPGEISILGTFYRKKSILAYISLKIDIIRPASFYYVILTSYVNQFSWFWYQWKEEILPYTMVPNNYTLGASIPNSYWVVTTPFGRRVTKRLRKTRLRCSCHVLKIETGRWIKLNIEDRVCDMCGDGYVEDEYYFVLICRVFKELCLKYISGQNRSHPCIPLFDRLMSCSTLLISLVFHIIFNTTQWKYVKILNLINFLLILLLYSVHTCHYVSFC